MRLLFIISGLHTGGAEMMLYRLLTRLEKTADCQVISLSGPGPVGERIAALGIPISHFDLRRGKLWQFVQLARFIRAWHPDLVHTWMYHANLLGGLASRLAGVKTIVWGIHHNNLASGLNKPSTLRIVRLGAWLSGWLPVYTLYCAQASRTTHLAAGYDDRHTDVIPNGFDHQQFHPDPAARSSLRHELGLADTTPLVGLIGRFDPLKNHAGFVQAAGRLYRQFPQVRFVCAGSGVDRDNAQLMQWISQNGLYDATFLLGRRDDMPRLMAALDVLALPSLGEALPNVVGEAMACGTPCVGCNVGDTCQLLGNTGICVAPADMDGLADGILQLLRDSKLRQRLGQAARDRIVSLYSLDLIAERHLQLYQQLLTRGAR